MADMETAVASKQLGGGEPEQFVVGRDVGVTQAR